MLQINETGTNGGDKSHMYGWQIVDAKGEMMWIDKRRLAVDPEYQRDVQDADMKVKRIAASWSWAACGVIIVARRDGLFFVVDGQHRVRAAMKLSAVQTLPCIVFESEGVGDEAKAFLRANKDRKPMTAMQSFKAMNVSVDPNAEFVNAMLDRAGMKVGNNGVKGAIQCVGALLGVAKLGHDRCQTVFDAAVAVCGSQALHSDIIKGFDYIYGRTDAATVVKAAKKLQTIGREDVLKSIAAAKAYRLAGGVIPCGEGILNAYNHRMRHKIEI